MIYILDTHTLVWYLEDNPKLGKTASGILDRAEARFSIPTLVICEIYYMAHKGKTARDLPKVLNLLKADGRFEIAPLSETVLHHLHTGLDIHDAIIVATALSLAKERKEKVSLLTRDDTIRGLGIVPVVWD